jgi:hypothetical protein
LTHCGHRFRRRVASVRPTTLSYNRLGSFRHDAAARHLHFRVVAHQKGHHPCHNRTGRQHNKAERCFASRIFDPANAPIEFISAMPPAAAEPVRKPVGRVQKVGIAA